MRAYWEAQEDIRGVSFPLWRFCQHRTKVRFITEADTIVDTGMLLRDVRKVMAWMTGGRCGKKKRLQEQFACILNCFFPSGTE
jgi:hypothetical protein